MHLFVSLAEWIEGGVGLILIGMEGFTAALNQMVWVAL